MPSCDVTWGRGCVVIPENGAGRLLPWVGPEGKPCYLVGGGTGYLSRVADNIECVQLGMAANLLDHAVDLLDDSGATPEQLRYLLARMVEALRDVHRIARSRGDRLPVPGDDKGNGKGEEVSEMNRSSPAVD